MSGPSNIRPGTAQDLAALRALYPRAFPDEDLTGIVEALLALETGVISLVATKGDSIAGHVLFTRDKGEGTSALLGPLCVAPEWQRRGIGSALVAAGRAQLAATGIGTIFVLGDPGYYGRLGFDTERNVPTPCPIPEAWAAAWQSMRIGDTTIAPPRTLILPDPWMDPALWTE